MDRRPLILISPSTTAKGEEFADASISLADRYANAIIAAGGVPMIFPATTERSVCLELVQQSQGVLLTGGDDIDPKRYTQDLPADLAKTLGRLEPERDMWEAGLIAEVFKQRKALFAICRGHQMLNVALGGTLVVDIATQVPRALNHQRSDCKNKPVHEIQIAPDSLLARVTGEHTLAVNSTHHQAIGRLADELRVVAQSSDGVIEAMELKEPGRLPFLLSVQFHPERLIDSNAAFMLLFRTFISACEQRPGSNL